MPSTENKNRTIKLHMRRILTCFIIFTFSLINGLFSQTGNEIKGLPGVGSQGVVVTVKELMKLEAATPPQSSILVQEEFKAGNKFKSPSPEALPGNSFPQQSGAQIIQLDATQSIHSNFQGIQLSESSSIPPDCMGSVSYSQLGIVTNGRLKFYAKPSVCDAPLVTSVTTNVGSLNNPVFSVSLTTFFSSVAGGAGVTDPHMYFDRLSQRWFIVAINLSGASNRIVIAMSNSSEVTAQSSFTFYFFNHDNGAPAGNPDRGSFMDYPMVGIDKFALYIGGIIFNSSGNFIGSSAFVVNKAALINGGNLQFTAFRQVGLVNTGIFAPQGVYNDDPEATRGYFFGVDNEVFSRLSYIVVNNPGSASPTISQGNINVPATYYPYPQVALGSTKPLDALGDERLLDATMMRNKLTGVNSIWTAHHIAVAANGVAVTANGVAGARNAIRWYQLSENNGVPSLVQSGTLFDNASTNPKGYWMGSIMASGQGHAVAGASVASSNLHANAVVAGRYFSQNTGVLNPPVNITNFTAIYDRTGTDDQRWGDYSQTVVDPSDDMTMWSFQEYANANNTWGLRAVQLKAPPPAVPNSISAIVCDGNRNATVTLSGQATDFAGFFDPGPGRGGPEYPKRLSVASTGNVNISNIELLSATQIRFTANFTNAVLGSQQTLTITNPDCQSVTFNYSLPASCGGTTPGPVETFRVDKNPVSGEMIVFVPESGGTLRLLAMDGKLLESYTVPGTSFRINASKYPAGMYFLEFSKSGESESIKIVIL